VTPECWFVRNLNESRQGNVAGEITSDEDGLYRFWIEGGWER
jgi:hypothetical protein